MEIGEINFFVKINIEVCFIYFKDLENCFEIEVVEIAKVFMEDGELIDFELLSNIKYFFFIC